MLLEISTLLFTASVIFYYTNTGRVFQRLFSRSSRLP